MSTHSLPLAGALALACSVPLLASSTASFLGTAAPPASAGPLALVPFSWDPTPEFDLVTSVASPLGGNLLFSQPLEHLFYPYSWGSWSHDYEGDVYATAGSLFSLTITLPAGTGAFAFYAQPSDLVVQSFSVSESSGPALVEMIDGDSGASGFLFRAAPGQTLDAITIVTSAGFGVGEFSIAAVPEASPAWAGVAVLGACGLAWRRRRQS